MFLLPYNIYTGVKTETFCTASSQTHFPYFIHIMSTKLSSDSEALDVKVISVKITACIRKSTAALRASLSNVLFIWLEVRAKRFGLHFIPDLPLDRGPNMCGLETPAV